MFVTGLYLKKRKLYFETLPKSQTQEILEINTLVIITLSFIGGNWDVLWSNLFFKELCPFLKSYCLSFIFLTFPFNPICIHREVFPVFFFFSHLGREDDLNLMIQSHQVYQELGAMHMPVSLFFFTQFLKSPNWIQFKVWSLYIY